MSKNDQDKAAFIISLDFELFWGVRDNRTIESYGSHILGVRKAVPAILELFEKYGVKATWATVGFLFAKDKEELLNHVPQQKPQYTDSNLSPYTSLKGLGNTEEEDPYHLGYSMVKMIQAYKGQEMASHTFSHYYCLEPGQTEQSFLADTEAAVKIAGKEGVELKSIVFPRNQLNRKYIHICEKFGFTSYRGNETSWIYKERNEEQQALYKRGARLLDSYLNLSGYNTHRFSEVSKEFPYNIPASRFLRPFSPKLKPLDGLRLKRIKDAMTYAAEKKEIFQLWWHPHNFGSFLPENLQFLEKILDHYSNLRAKHGMASMTMADVANELMNVKR